MNIPQKLFGVICIWLLAGFAVAFVLFAKDTE